MLLDGGEQRDPVGGPHGGVVAVSGVKRGLGLQQCGKGRAHPTDLRWRNGQGSARTVGAAPGGVGLVGLPVRDDLVAVERNAGVTGGGPGSAHVRVPGPAPQPVPDPAPPVFSWQSLECIEQGGW